jgi:hypothetical protein
MIVDSQPGRFQLLATLWTVMDEALSIDTQQSSIPPILGEAPRRVNISLILAVAGAINRR